MRAAKATALAVLTAATLAGCSSTPDADAKNDPAAAATGDKALATVAVPPAYDATKGWDETLPWVPGDVDEPPVAVLPGGDAVAMLNVDAGGFLVQSRAADSGKVRWASAAWRPPMPMDGAKQEGEIPDVLGLEQDGRRFVVVSAHGMAGKDELHDGTEVVRLAVYAAEGDGTGRKPLREIDVPVSTDPGDWRVSADGGRLLVGFGEDGDYPLRSAAVDVVTGKVTPYDDAAGLLRQCDGRPLECGWDRVVAAGAKGPLVGLGHGFGVPGVWFSDGVRPEGVAAKTPFGFGDSWNGDVYGVAGGRFLAQWHRTGKDGSSEPTAWSVHEVGSGALLARMDCAYDDFPTVTSQGDSRNHPVVTSPSGRFLAAGPVAFDLQRKQGVCLQGDGNRKTITVGAIADDGTAYGKVGDDASGALVVRLDLTTATGEAKVLGAGVEIPQHTAVGGSGLFVARDQDDNVRVSVRAGR
ncbi:hypothetical protein ACIGEZ_25125 [Streptomyces sp. NPDC085481]|uniref:hypothetical protein n=1 Tax=Streptomyces sp. NPDC085481 TaxID=3365727 RepID=UPI0037D38D6C